MTAFSEEMEIPFDYKISRINNGKALINKVIFLHHGKENLLTPIDKSSHLKRLLEIVLLPYWDITLLFMTSLVLKKFSNQLELFDFYFVPNHDVMPTIFDLMEGTK